MSFLSGELLLVVKGFAFLYTKTLKNGTTCWRCVSRTTRCSAKVVTPSTDSTLLLDAKLTHNHEAEGNLSGQALGDVAIITIEGACTKVIRSTTKARPKQKHPPAYNHHHRKTRDLKIGRYV